MRLQLAKEITVPKSLQATWRGSRTAFLDVEGSNPPASSKNREIF
jgi:hypothetical protein